MKLTKDEVRATLHLSSREAATWLGVGKSTVNDARKHYGLKHEKGTLPFIPETYPGPRGSEKMHTPEDSASDAPESPVTHVTIEDDLEADGVTNTSHKLSYAYSEWDKPDGTKGRSRRVIATAINETEPVEQVDPDELLAKVRADVDEYVPVQPEKGIPATFVISFNDWQYGKKTLQGSTEDTIRIVMQSVQNAKHRIEQLNRAGYVFNELIIIFGGDIVEGCANTPQGAFGIEMGQRQQIEGAASLGLHALDKLAPIFPKVKVMAVRGNHGENRINNGRPTTPEDNNDTLIASIIRTAASRDPNLAHVKFRIADDHAGIWVTTEAGWLLGTTHGDVYGKGVSGATTERKVNTWYKNMAAGRDMLGMVDVMITHHYHHSQSADYGSWEWHQTPAQDGALSEYFRQASGNFSLPGVLTFIMTEEMRYGEEKVV